MVHNSHMDGVASAFDLVMAATVAILTVAGVYWALVRRVDKADSAISAEANARQSDLKAIGSDIVRIDQRLGKVEETAEKLRRRSDRTLDWAYAKVRRRRSRQRPRAGDRRLRACAWGDCVLGAGYGAPVGSRGRDSNSHLPSETAEPTYLSGLQSTAGRSP